MRIVAANGIPDAICSLRRDCQRITQPKSVGGTEARWGSLSRASLPFSLNPYRGARRSTRICDLVRAHRAESLSLTTLCEALTVLRRRNPMGASRGPTPQRASSVPAITRCPTEQSRLTRCSRSLILCRKSHGHIFQRREGCDRLGDAGYSRGLWWYRLSSERGGRLEFATAISSCACSCSCPNSGACSCSVTTAASAISPGHTTAVHHDPGPQ